MKTMTTEEFERGLMKRGAHAAYVGIITGLFSLAYLLLFKVVFVWLWPNAIYTMSEWVSIPLLLTGMMSVIMMPVAGTYTLICMVGLLWLDKREARRAREHDREWDERFNRRRQ